MMRLTRWAPPPNSLVPTKIPNPKQNADKTNSHILSATSKQTDKQQDNKPTSTASTSANLQIINAQTRQHGPAQDSLPTLPPRETPGKNIPASLIATLSSKQSVSPLGLATPTIRVPPLYGYPYSVLSRVRYDTNLSSILPPPVPIKPPALREPSWPIASGRFRQCSIPTSQCPSPRGRLR
ncbi:hypothetical protein CCM_02802 [Cordyceps militaris CM01]|uniref:Uncharacterized protein n=1 Tax=Cordyceps militaris (strain CM01) TaxID=983644 RepID=G3JBV8_CORMM|nr:uncharacterized protein CCM_02802 [Cordyceps militaris CM01]EGX94531.1 hypothetical protein CCM_02802 [Cordyceps militaris CM01]